MRIGQVLPSLPDEYNVQIGAIITKWATLEYVMMFIIWRAMGLGNEEGRVLTVGMGNNVLCGILRNLPKKWITDEAIKNDVIALVDYVSDHAEMRNYIAHGIWTKYENDPLPYLNFMRKGDQRLLPGSQHLPPNQLKIFSESLETMIQLGSQIANKLEFGTVGVTAPPPDTHSEKNPAGFPTQTQTPQ